MNGRCCGGSWNSIAESPERSERTRADKAAQHKWQGPAPSDASRRARLARADKAKARTPPPGARPGCRTAPRQHLRARRRHPPGTTRATTAPSCWTRTGTTSRRSITAECAATLLYRFQQRCLMSRTCTLAQLFSFGTRPRKEARIRTPPVKPHGKPDIRLSLTKPT